MNKKFILFTLLSTTLVVGCMESRQKPVFEYLLNNPASNGSRFPNLHQDQSGAIYLGWVTNVEESIFSFQYSKYTDEGWYEPETIHIGSDYYVNWADLVSVVGVGGQAIASHRYIRPQNGESAYQTEVMFRDADTGRWDNSFQLSTGQISDAHGFVRLEPLSEEAVLAIWLEDGRAQMDGRVEEDGFANSRTAGASPSVSLHSAVLSADGERTITRVVDEEVCTCCHNDLVATQNGYTTAYRGQDGDVRIAHFDSESTVWSTPEVIHQNGILRESDSGCKLEGPSVHAGGAYTAVAWYSESEESSSIHLARSVYPENTFQDPILIADSEPNLIGRADVVSTDSGDSYVSWMRQTEEQAQIMITHVDAEGSIQGTYHVGTTDASTSSGIPRMAKTDEAIVVAWTQTLPVFRVRTVRFPL